MQSLRKDLAPFADSHAATSAVAGKGRRFHLMSTQVHKAMFDPEPARSSHRNLGPISVGYGKCARCSCPGFFGSSYTCSRGGCGHHYDEHW